MEYFAKITSIFSNEGPEEIEIRRTDLMKSLFYKQST